MKLVSITHPFILLGMIAVSLVLCTWPSLVEESETAVKYLLDEIEQGKFWNTLSGLDEASGAWEAFLENEGRPIVEQFYR